MKESRLRPAKKKHLRIRHSGFKHVIPEFRQAVRVAPPTPLELLRDPVADVLELGVAIRPVTTFRVDLSICLPGSAPLLFRADTLLAKATSPSCLGPDYAILEKKCQ